MEHKFEGLQHGGFAAEYGSDEKKQIFDVLSIDYLVVALCDFDEGTLVHLKQAERSNLNAVNQALGEDNHSFSERIRYYYDHFVVKESARTFWKRWILRICAAIWKIMTALFILSGRFATRQDTSSLMCRSYPCAEAASS